MKYLKIIDDQLCTPIIKYGKRDAQITCIGAVHIGTKEYYAKLQEELDAHPFGFFEGIKPLVDEESLPVEKRKYKWLRENSRKHYESLARYISVTTQHQSLSYSKKWENHDMTLDELILKAPISLLENFHGNELDDLDELYQQEPEAVTTVIKKAMELRTKIPILPITAKWRTMIEIGLTERNQRLFDAIEPILVDQKPTEIGIIYGAAHIQGINTFLRKKGFKKESTHWLPAWDMKTTYSFWQATKKIVKAIVQHTT